MKVNDIEYLVVIALDNVPCQTLNACKKEPLFCNNAKIVEYDIDDFAQVRLHNFFYYNVKPFVNGPFCCFHLYKHFTNIYIYS